MLRPTTGECKPEFYPYPSKVLDGPRARTPLRLLGALTSFQLEPDVPLLGTHQRPSHVYAKCRRRLTSKGWIALTATWEWDPPLKTARPKVSLLFSITTPGTAGGSGPPRPHRKSLGRWRGTTSAVSRGSSCKWG